MNILSFNESYQEFKPLLSLVLFCSGCNLKCYHCFNYDYVTDDNVYTRDSLDIISTNALSNPMIKGITFLGGEPTIWKDKLIHSLHYCKVNGLKTKLFTNGTNPNILRNILEENLLDSISIDIKTISNDFIINTHLDSYIMDHSIYIQLVLQSLDMCLNNGITPELRSVNLIEGNTEEVKQFVEKYYPELDLIISPDLYHKMK